jgi:hypothetical protein
MAYALRPKVARRALRVCLVVGVILNTINQGPALFSGQELNPVQILLTFCVPYCVSTYSSVMALREQSQAPNTQKSLKT